MLNCLVHLLTLFAFVEFRALARPDSYAVWAADSVIARGQSTGLDSNGNPKVIYDDGEFQLGLRRLYDRTKDEKYYQHLLKAANTIVSDSGALPSSYKMSDYQLDPIRTGSTFLYLNEKTKNTKWKKAADTFRLQLDRQPRTGQGQLWHKLVYPNQGWLDGIYMGDVFYAQYTKLFQATNTTAWSDIEKQFKLIYDNTLQASNDTNYIGLLYHGYDYSHTASWASPDRGHCPEIWDRALGWYMMALVDVLEFIPTSNSAYSTILKALQNLVPPLIKAADSTSGVWWLVMTQPGRDGNYFESSGSAMFVYSLLKGVRLGYIKDTDGSVIAAAKKAYNYMTSNWVVEKSDGTMDWMNTVEVGSLSGNGTYEYYISVNKKTNDLKGVAAFLFASLEFEEL
ncbi:cell wall glycosyl hydrolase [Moniliophthora roreri MCA 2997]|uniref:Cell wall glycosyl hydrolase n=1 Tax=Moniliophthora roreri (strain MCA 2997) TaxID=1381753 RepID=V2XHA7_MONRO|nr:cell wall glycosyl hydrolase [Moniliophthora roreri MCA 2997]